MVFPGGAVLGGGVYRGGWCLQGVVFTLLTLLTKFCILDGVDEIVHCSLPYQCLLNVYPSITYCLKIYDNISKSGMNRICKLQKRAARVILDVHPDSSSKPLFNKPWVVNGI